jgi:hypothetical protein
MFKWLIRRQLAAHERKLGVSADCLRDIRGTDERAMLALGMIGVMAGYQRDLPPSPGRRQVSPRQGKTAARALNGVNCSCPYQ